MRVHKIELDTRMKLHNNDITKTMTIETYFAMALIVEK